MKNLFGISFVIFLFLISRSSLSDMRSYLWTYEYIITDPGKAEIEHYLTIQAPSWQNIKGLASIQHRIEVEVGMTKHFDFSIYHNFFQNPDKNLVYSGFDLRARFLIGEKNQYPLDPLIYIEYGNDANLSKPKFETKLILAKDIGKFNIAFNPIFEVEKDGTTWEFVPAYALGMRYEFTKLLRLGIEFKGERDIHFIGAVVSHGKDNLWIAAGPMFMYSKNPNNKSEFLFRTIIGLGL
ncbi:MAG: hypothetical protein ACK42Z_00360 [Candidatus Kapaibacteriota bacterium]